MGGGKGEELGKKKGRDGRAVTNLGNAIGIVKYEG